MRNLSNQFKSNFIKENFVKKVESEGLTKQNKRDFKCAEEIM